jgi:hypothetical protein
MRKPASIRLLLALTNINVGGPGVARRAASAAMSCEHAFPLSSHMPCRPKPSFLVACIHLDPAAGYEDGIEAASCSR